MKMSKQLTFPVFGKFQTFPQSPVYWVFYYVEWELSWKDPGIPPSLSCSCGLDFECNTLIPLLAVV
jgi:hypothetical protein